MQSLYPIYQLMKSLNFRHIGETFHIHKSHHLIDPRKSSQYSRDYSISDQAYIDIFKLAVSNGLRSFRNSQAVIIVNTHKGFCAILVDIPAKTNIFKVITTFISYTSFYKMFIKIPNRINLLSYTLPALSTSQRKFKDLALVSKTIRSEGTTISASELLSYY